MMHHISKLRLESHIALIRLKERPDGFRIVSTHVALIDNLEAREIEQISVNIASVRANQPDTVFCLAKYFVDESPLTYFNVFSLGLFSEFSDVQARAADYNDRQVDFFFSSSGRSSSGRFGKLARLFSSTCTKALESSTHWIYITRSIFILHKQI
jgi:hypothetical protein